MTNVELENRIDKTINEYNIKICDLSEEEVYFSRNESDFYYNIDQSNSSNINTPDVRTPEYLDLDIQFDPIRQDLGDSFFSIHNDQVESRRLLNVLIRRLSAVVNLLGQYATSITIQKWSVFFDTERILNPLRSQYSLKHQIIDNLSYYRGNYLCIYTIFTLYWILTSPMLMISMTFYVLALILISSRRASNMQTWIFNHRLNSQLQYVIITLLAIPLFCLSGATEAIFWSFCLSTFLIVMHASLYSCRGKVVTQQVAASGLALIHNGTYNIRYTNTPEISRPMKSPLQYYSHYPKVAKIQPEYVSLGTSTSLYRANSNSPPASQYTQPEQTLEPKYINPQHISNIGIENHEFGGGRYTRAVPDA